MHESGRDSAQISRETQKSGSQSDLQRLRGKKVEGRLKPAEADRALDGYSLHWSTYFGHKISKIRCQKNK